MTWPGGVFGPGFTVAAFRAGMRDAVPLLIGLTPFGLVVGIVAQGQGVGLGSTAAMSGAVYAGSAQLVALTAWTVPAPVVAATLGALVINLRLALMGPVLAPWLDRLRGPRLWLSLFLLADQNWALSVTSMRKGRWDAAYLVGSGIPMWLAWVATTALGWLLGGIVRPPAGHPVFFAALAVFVCMLVTMWRGKGDLLPWAVAGGVALMVAQLFPGTSWHILAGALAGAGAGAWRDRRRRRGA